MASLSTHGGPADSSRPPNARISGIDGNRTSFDGVTIAFHWVTVILVARVAHNRNMELAVTR
jgi:hypothetical protein